VSKRLRTLGVVSSILAFALCFLGGAWALAYSDWDKDDALQVAIGFYFIGKAIFVGTLLLLVSFQSAGGDSEI
jgi:hypothetical protein